MEEQIYELIGAGIAVAFSLRLLGLLYSSIYLHLSSITRELMR